ncbi:MAG: Inositol 2-dehydrogenase [Alphaproteobacteria bacterium MarineAlpha2_Bin1]|nr:MAG: Inositol 2-dehydrogenase [Alphaproteobacteria bacterium MarineAlpha2_Bin1]
MSKIINLEDSLDIRVAVVGCGYWGKNLVRAFSEIGNLYALSDTNTNLANELSNKYMVKNELFENLLASNDIGAVAIATPAITHYKLARAALMSGKDVFVEKPIALNIDDAEELVKIATENNKILMVGHLLQYHPGFLKLKEMVSSGKLGELQYIYSNRLNLGKFRKEENILWSFAPHDVSMILNLFESLPERVTAIGSTYLQSKIADVTTTHLQFPNGKNAHIYVSWLHPYKEQKLVVIGNKGMAVFDDGRDWGEKLSFYAHEVCWNDDLPIPKPAEAEMVKFPISEPLKLEAEHFIESITKRTKPRTDGKEGTMVLSVLDAAEKSMNSKTTIKLC